VAKIHRTFPAVLKLQVEPKVIRQFKRQARAAFPRETLAYLFGHQYPDRTIVTELWTPNGLVALANNNTIQMVEHAEYEAEEHAKEIGLELLGDVHTHPWTKDQLSDLHRLGTSSGTHPSESDWDRIGPGRRWITGICLINECENGRLICRIRFWGPLTHIILTPATL
jgi:proteasome lid subunit RPN8/RPN11